MNNMTVLSVLLMVGSVIKGQQGPCTTVSGGQGQCKSIYNCKPLLSLVNKTNRTLQEMDLLKKSHCGFEGQVPVVCCPGENDPPPTSSNQCFTPEGKPGQCISLYSCPAIADLLKAPIPNENIVYVQQSKCDGPDKYSVCCGEVPNYLNVQRGKCTTSVSAFPPDPRTECCGIDSSPYTKIIVGPPTVDTYPWLVLIEYVKGGVTKTLCGGALISGKYVLTAGHCVAGHVLNGGMPTNIRLGEYDTSNEGPDCMVVEGGGTDCSDGVIRIRIERTIPHPQYNPAHPQKRNDIALIRMAEMAPYTDFIRPICLPTADITQGTGTFVTTAAGWGADSTNQSSSTVKLKVDLPIVSKSVCQQAYSVPGRKIDLWKGQFCAGGEKGKDSCKGDSGGPLMYENGRIFEVIGMLSFGPIPCVLEDIPGVYTNVYEYSAWIRSTIIP